MTEFDSILKEKKKYEEPKKENKPKKFPWFKIDLLCLILILIISYFFYYTKVLSPEKIFLNDLQEITAKYQNIFIPLQLTNLNKDNYNLTGTISLNEKKYNFDINKNKDTMQLSLNQDNKYFNYYSIANENYLNLSEKTYKLNEDNYIYLIYKLKDYLSNLPKDKFIKKFYLNGTIPIVESNLELTNEDLHNNLNLNTNNSYKVLSTLKNNAITNDIISMKITLNNETTSKRIVISYEDNTLTIKDDNQTINFKLEEKNKDFTLKIYKNDIIYSVLTGTNQESSYQYTYQIIDKFYNITLKIIENNGLSNYELNSIIEKDNTKTESNLSITFATTSNSSIENQEITNYINYETLTEEEKKQYKTELENIINPLKQFIKNHQQGIN